MLHYQSDNSILKKHFHFDIYHEDGFRSHFHRYFEVIYVLDGHVTVSIDGIKSDIIKGDCAFILPNEIHDFQSSNNTTVWVGLFSDDLVQNFADEIKDKTTDKFIFTPSAMLQEFFNNATDKKLSTIFIIQSFLHLLCHEYYISCAPFTINKKMDSLAIHSILEYVSANFKEDITITSLAKKFGYNKNYLSDVFKKTTNMNFRYFLNCYRIENAKQILSSTKIPITKTAFDCGFESVRSFNRVFKQFESLTPREYREMNGV